MSERKNARLLRPDIVQVATNLVHNYQIDCLRSEDFPPRQELVLRIAEALAQARAEERRACEALLEAWHEVHCPSCTMELELSWGALVAVIRYTLAVRYPADVFTADSGDAGPRFLAKLREALDMLPNRGPQEGGGT